MSTASLDCECDTIYGRTVYKCLTSPLILTFQLLFLLRHSSGSLSWPGLSHLALSFDLPLFYTISHLFEFLLQLPSHTSPLILSQWEATS